VLFLLFELGRDRYALESGGIVQVLPLVDIKRIPRAPAGVAGVFNYQGVPVPVIDLSELALGRPALSRFSTRIVLANYVDDAGETHLLGLIAERARETMRREPADLRASGIANDSTPYLGPITSDERGLIQWVEVNRLLPEPVREQLFKETAR
jgi:chemotaxis-related protein WspB